MSSRGLTLQDKNQGTALMSACIVAAQAVMVPMAMLVGRKADVWGCKPLFLAGFAILSLRSFLYPDAPPKPTDLSNTMGRGTRPIRRKVRFGCPSWTLIEPCASRRSLILGASWQVCGRWS